MPLLLKTAITYNPWLNSEMPSVLPHNYGWQPYTHTSLATTSLSLLHVAEYKCRFTSTYTWLHQLVHIRACSDTCLPLAFHWQTWLNNGSDCNVWQQRSVLPVEFQTSLESKLGCTPDQSQQPLLTLELIPGLWAASVHHYLKYKR